MSILSVLTRGFFGNSIAKPIKAINDLFSSVVLTEAQKAKKNSLMAELEAKAGLRCISKAKALLVYMCTAALGLYWIPQIILANYVCFKYFIENGTMMAFPMDMNQVLGLVLSLLGLSLMHIKK